MPAILVEEPLEDGDNSDPLASAGVEPPQHTQSEIDAAQAVLDGEDVPEKYRGKSARELLDIVKNQESLIGRHSQELGELRQQNGTLRGLVDQSLALRHTGEVGRPEQFTEESLSDEDFVLNPVDATKRTVQSETQQLRNELSQLKSQARGIQFDRDYPEAGSDIQDPDFIDFVKRSPVRQRLAASAFADPNNIDYDSAAELFDLYEDYKGFAKEDTTETPTSSTEDADASKAPVQDAPKQAPSMLTGTGSKTTAEHPASGKPIYSQAALNELMESKPDLYWREDTQRKIAEAYKEKRVVQDV